MAGTERLGPDTTVAPPQDINTVLSEAECLHREASVEAELDRMAEQITGELADADPLVLCVMVGALVTTAALVTRLPFPVQIDYVHVGRYRGATRGGRLLWHRHPELSLHGRTVLVIDDILDEGYTLDAILGYCHEAGAQRVRSAVLVEKRHGRPRADVLADYVGLSVPDRYVFGYGMDYRSHLRNLTGIYALKEG
jgi:hypoxanthine phosphoribosyltransferase